MMLGDLLTLRQQQLPVKVVVLNNGAQAFVELETKVDGIVTYGTDLENPSFAAVARAIGLHGVRIERPSELEDGLRTAFEHDGSTVVEVMTVRHELSIPPEIMAEQVKGFTLWATRSILSGRGDEVVEVAKTNLRQLSVE
jgi:pyruvate dehydrogenase (quinone)